MIFAYTLDKVLAGEKWQTRRIAKPNEKLYEVGKSYAVQPNRGKKAVARIMITGLRQEMVGEINEHDAQAEGYESCEAFIAAWQVIHGKRVNLNQIVWVIEFELQPLKE
ncbi:MAG: ASCH domain-containing protein [Chloroflexota bacterium]